MRLVAELTDKDGRLLARCVVAAGDDGHAFTRWVDGLPAAACPALVRLRAYGYAADLDGLQTQLSQALATADVPADVAAAGRRVLALLTSRRAGDWLLLGEGP